jgi:hypothetical protein
MPDPNAERAVEILHRGGRNAGLDEDEVMELALRTVGVVRTINALRDTLARQGCTQAQCDQAVRIFEEHVILGIEEAERLAREEWVCPALSVLGLGLPHHPDTKVGAVPGRLRAS